MKPLVSACIISYNQEPFIEEALSGCLTQQFEGDYEIVVGDDASTDRTPSIIAGIASEDPRVRILNARENLGMHGNWTRTIQACNGKYIAICEGDDRWDDHLKIQKQVDLLEQHPEAAGCFSNAMVIDDNGVTGPYPYVDKEFSKLSANEFLALGHNPVPTCTAVFRNAFFHGFPASYYNSPFADWILHALLIQQGDYLFLRDATASYRQHLAGIWSGSEEETQHVRKLKALRIIHTIVDKEYRPAVDQAIGTQLDQLLYFYREKKKRLKYFLTWVKLKSLKIR